MKDVQRFTQELLAAGGCCQWLDLEYALGPVRSVGLVQGPEPGDIRPQKGVLDAAPGRGIPPSEGVELQEGLAGFLVDEAQHDLLDHDETAEAKLDPPVFGGPVEIRLPVGGGVAVDQVMGEVLVGTRQHPAPDIHFVLRRLQGGVDPLAHETGGDRSVGGDPGDAGHLPPKLPSAPASPRRSGWRGSCNPVLQGGESPNRQRPVSAASQGDAA